VQAPANFSVGISDWDFKLTVAQLRWLTGKTCDDDSVKESFVLQSYEVQMSRADARRLIRQGAMQDPHKLAVGIQDWDFELTAAQLRWLLAKHGADDQVMESFVLQASWIQMSRGDARRLITDACPDAATNR
jgi:hypothetical protein